MKNSIKALSASLLAAAVIAPSAQAEITANVALTTDYVWRGISQNTDESPALQGGFDYASESGFYAGVWGSNVNFGGNESIELDVYGGWGTELENGLGLDFGVIRYSYHGGADSSDLDFTEFYAGLSYAGFGFIYSLGDEFGDQYEFSYGHDIGAVSLAAAYGNYDVNDDGDDYDYYSLGVSGSFGGESDIGWDVSYWGTSGDLVDNVDVADDRIVFTVSKEF
ncbi:MAG: TorF family putative porin [Gammaproteobacteria bacterium]|nr:TorF family putative porin [Gammaproteobacteria bacterium]